MNTFRVINLRKQVFTELFKTHKMKYSGQFQRNPLNYIRQSSVANYKVFFEETRSFSKDEWRKIRQDIINTQKHINEINIDATIMGLCTKSEHLVTAKSYISFLEDENIEPNVVTFGKLLKLYYLHYMTDNIQTDSNKKEIMKIFSLLTNNQDVFDFTTCENLILGLISLDENVHWRKCFKFLEMMKISSTPSLTVYNAIVWKCFKENEIDQGWRILQEMVENERQPKCEVFIEYFKNIKNITDIEEQRNHLEKMFTFIGSRNIQISSKVVKYLKQMLSSSLTTKNAAMQTTITKKGECKVCHMFMDHLKLPKEEFDKLSNSFLEKVIYRKDVFQKTNPMEIQRFIKFVNETSPYDCVIDGLNVAFSFGNTVNSKTSAKLLSTVVQYFSREKKKVLVIGRQHMNKWPKDIIDAIRKNSYMFLTSNLSEDDPFLLYATLKSGPKTDFFSRDRMRSHAYLLGKELKPIFRLWQQEHQYSLLMATKDGNVVIKEPTKFCINAHKVKNIWHIPYRETYSSNPKESFEIPSSWLCIKML